MRNRWIHLAFFVWLSVFSCRSVWADDSSLSAKLDQVIETQERILSELAAIREELQVVKIRASNT